MSLRHRNKRSFVKGTSADPNVGKNKSEKDDVKLNNYSGRHIWRRIAGILAVIFSTLAILVLCSVIWALSQWSNLRMDEIVYELTAPLEGTGNGMVGDYILKCVTPAIIVLAVEVIVLAGSHFRRVRIKGRVFGIVIALSLAALILPAAYFLHKVGAYEYIVNRNTDSDFIEDNYVDPSSVELTFPETKRNLIYIYIESTEITFADTENGGAFEENVIPELTKLAQENEDFSGTEKALDGGYALYGNTWTMGALYGTTSGLPLNTKLDDNQMQWQSSFFPNIVTLGDILDDAGYHQVFVLGSDVAFGGRELYYTEHGNYEIRDYNYAKETGRIPEDYSVWWGMEDEKMFDMAKDTLKEYGEKEEPFNVTLLTVDTHFPDGYICDLCRDEFGEQYSNVYACASRQVTEFVKWCQQQDWYDNTTIVITGDHPTMDVDYCEGLSDDYVRKTYTCYINAAASPVREERREYTTLDDFPTALAALGVQIEGDRLGLGTNLFSDHDTLTEIYGNELISTEVSRNSEFLNQLEAVDKETQEMIHEFEDVQPPLLSLDAETNQLQVEIPSLEDKGLNITYVSVKTWYNGNGTYPHDQVNMTQNEDGSYTAQVPLDKYTDVPYINYKIMVSVDDGSYMDYGAEGKFVPETEDVTSVSEPEN